MLDPKFIQAFSDAFKSILSLLSRYFTQAVIVGLSFLLYIVYIDNLQLRKDKDVMNKEMIDFQRVQYEKIESILRQQNDIVNKANHAINETQSTINTLDSTLKIKSSK